MQQHPVPQNVTSYQFRLVGDMTLKQFLELATGVVIAWAIFSSGLNFLLKWTLGPMFAFFGFALAFIPIQDRPLDKWLLNFIKTLYHPNQFVWQPTSQPLDIFAPRKLKPLKTPTSASHPAELEEYLQTLPAGPTGSFDQAENQYLNRIASLFSALGVSLKQSSIPSLTKNPLPAIKTSVEGVRIRQLMTPQACLLPSATIYQTPSPQLAAMPITPKPVKSKPKPKQSVSKPPASTQPTKPAVTKPKSTTTTPPHPIKQKTTLPAPSSPPAQPITSPTFAPDVIIPLAPEKPNLISGITLDKAGKIIPHVIIEIRDIKNHPVRALKSNKLGQFFIATPLPDGIYQIEAEHDQHRFAIMKLEAKNEIIPPLKIQAIS